MSETPAPAPTPTPDHRTDLRTFRVSSGWGYAIANVDEPGEVNLTFRKLADATMFVELTGCAASTALTFPERVGFEGPVTITISNYTAYFKPIS